MRALPPLTALVLAACAATSRAEPHRAGVHAFAASGVDAAASQVPAGPRCPADAAASTDVVVLETGAARGVVEGGVRAWKGLPYAAPPVGEKRWRAPAPPPCFSGVRDATSFAAGCIQVTPTGKLAGGSEDCLYANVWAKDGAAAAPVIVFLHGGYFAEGKASAYDAAYLAARAGAMVVTLDYRLGALAGPDFAVRDAEAALSWVQTNAAAFGGDASRVTLFGEGAGATIALALLASPAAVAPFSRAVLDGPHFEPRTDRDLAAARDAVAAAVGCVSDAPPACLLGKPAEAVATAVPPVDDRGFRWTPAASPQELRPVPVLLAGGADDAAPYQWALHAAPAPDDEIAYVKTARARLGKTLASAEVDAVMKLYAWSTYGSGQRALVAMETDRLSTCPARRLLGAMKGPAWRLLWTHVDESGLDRQYGAGRGAELPYLFHAGGSRGFAPLPEELALSDAFIDAAARFAATGDPNGGALPAWPRHDATDPYLAFDVKPAAGAGVDTAACDLWDSLTR